MRDPNSVILECSGSRLTIRQNLGCCMKVTWGPGKAFSGDMRHGVWIMGSEVCFTLLNRILGHESDGCMVPAVGETTNAVPSLT